MIFIPIILKHFRMFSVKCCENIPSQSFLIPIFSECLLNVYLQTFGAIIGDFKGHCQKLPHMQFLKVRIEWGYNL